MITYKTDAGEYRIIHDEWIPEQDRAMLLKDAGQRSARKLRRSFAQADATEAAWNAAATPAQRRIGWGDAWRQDFPGNQLMRAAVIYGRVLTLFEVIEAEQATHCTIAELDQVIARIREGYGHGWRYVRGYSQIEPDGEPGYTHIAVMTPLTIAEFDAARAAGWPA